MNIDKFVTDISKNPAKAIIYAVLLVLGIILVYWLYTQIKGGVSASGLRRLRCVQDLCKEGESSLPFP